MDIEVLDQKFNRVAVLDTYESLIWTDRYNDYGDFEIYMPMNTAIYQILKPDYYLVNTESEYMMIIENLEISTDSENGAHFKVTGRSLESILNRRIIWAQTNLTGNLQNAIKTIINQNVINPSKSIRKINNFVFKDSDDQRITDLTIPQLQFTGDVLYDAIKKIADLYNVGFKVILNENEEFVFSLFYGEDRSNYQDVLPNVTFSPEFDNIINSIYSENKEGYCNVTLVAGEGEGANRKTAITGDDTLTDLDRRELFTDARDISSNIGNKTTLNATQYTNALIQRGNEKLEEVKIQKEFEGEVDTTQLYEYGVDFNMGDIVQLENEFDSSTRARVIEFIYSNSTSGIEKYPRFKILD